MYDSLGLGKIFPDFHTLSSPGYWINHFLFADADHLVLHTSSEQGLDQL